MNEVSQAREITDVDTVAIEQATISLNSSNDDLDHFEREVMEFFSPFKE